MPNSRIYWLHALTPTHAGVGRGVDYIDLPIDRDGVTGWPIIRGSTFKGVWADYYRATTEARRSDVTLRAAFGIADDDNNSNAGALIPTDARLVCLPVRSFRGTFAWVSSPLCLRALRRTLVRAGVTNVPPEPLELADDVAHHTSHTALVEGTQIVLEDLDFKAARCNTATAWADHIAMWAFPGDTDWQVQFTRRFLVLPDLAFDFLCETGTEVHTRVRINDDTKTVAPGSLWTEESLPAETILAGLIQCDRIFNRNGEDITPSGLLERFAKETLTLQIGGKATIGRGWMRCVFTDINGGTQ
ncbi:MAG: type III-B CRISPR module RAMP protein Cmr4 [Isosphaeraceae bacterium]|jgi:CRISPR-associated protein Cmr4|nr:MAG: type III-B CRISPR module RAMP protein Cmr4 [Isosphaeraceae bacterium]